MARRVIVNEIRRPLIGARGRAVELRERCRIDGHPSGCWSPGLAVTVCHCGRIWRPGKHPVDTWPRTPRCSQQLRHHDRRYVCDFAVRSDGDRCWMHRPDAPRVTGGVDNNPTARGILEHPDTFTSH